MILREVNRVGEGKKNVPKLRFKGYEDAWEQRKLGDVKDVRDGTHDSPKYITTGYPLVTSKNLTENGLDYSDISYISEDDFLAINKRSKVEIGDIIFGMIGTIGNPVMVTSEGFAIKNVALLKNNGIINNSFLIHLLKSPIFTKYIKLENAGGTQKFLGLSQIRNFECLIPNEGEQVILGEFFIALDNLITLHQRKYDALKAMKKTLLSKMFPKDGEDVPEIRFKGFTDAWEQRKLKEIGEIQTGNTPPTTDPQNYSEDGMLWVTPTDIEELVITKTAKRISEFGRKKARIASKGSVLVTCIASIGKNTLLSEDAAFNQQINSITPNGEYDSYFLLTQSFKISEKMANSAAAATMQIVNKSQFSNLDTILPIYTEQVEIGRLFLYLDNLITLHQRRSSRIIGLSAAEFC